MPRRDPHAVLGVAQDASLATIKAAWRRLARQHHPDLAGADQAAARTATRQMAEINAAYEELTDPTRRLKNGARPGSGTARSRAAGQGPEAEGARAGGSYRTRPAGGGPPPSPRARPVTGRLDTTETFRPRNQTTTRGRAHPPGQPPPRVQFESREAPRASDPTGPLERARMRRFRRPARPELADALALEIGFGKFHGHTLGEIASFEPSYIDWIAQTIGRDRDLVAAARVIQEDLDRRGITRRRHPSRGSSDQASV